MEKHASIPFDLAWTSCFSTLASSCKDAKKNRPTHYETSSRPSDAAPNTARPVSACQHCDTSDTESLLLLVVSYASDPRLSSLFVPDPQETFDSHSSLSLIRTKGVGHSTESIRRRIDSHQSQPLFLPSDALQRSFLWLRFTQTLYLDMRTSYGEVIGWTTLYRMCLIRVSTLALACILFSKIHLAFLLLVCT